MRGTGGRDLGHSCVVQMATMCLSRGRRMDRPEISVVLGSYNRAAFLRAAITSVRDNGISVPLEIIVVDGGSSDGSLRWLTGQKDIITIVQHNRGTHRGKPVQRRSWGYFMNLGFKCAQGEYILMISDDCLLVPNAAMAGLRHAEALRSGGRKVGAVAFYWRDWPEQEEYHVGLTLSDRMFVNHGLYVRQALEEVGWIDEDRYRFYHADGDLCLKLWAQGYEVVDCREAYVEHFAHSNRKTRQSNRERRAADWTAYLDRWSGIYYDRYCPRPGGWISRLYVDAYRTVARFPRSAVLSARLRSAARKLCSPLSVP